MPGDSLALGASLVHLPAQWCPSLCPEFTWDQAINDMLQFMPSYKHHIRSTRAAQSGGLGRFWQGEKMVSKSGRTDFLASKADQQVKQHISNHTEHEL